MRTIIKIKDRYFLYSKVVDAPVTLGLTLEDLKRFVKEEYGYNGLRDLEDQLTRIEVTGTGSRIHDSLNEYIACNRAGENESFLTADQIYKKYVLE